MIDVGGHRLYIECTGSGGPAVILQAGLGASSSSWAGIAPAVAASTTVCAYDRAGHGRSDEAAGPGTGSPSRPTCTPCSSAPASPGRTSWSGIRRADPTSGSSRRRYPDEVAGMVLLDAQPADAFTALPDYPGVYQTFRTVAALSPSLARIGLLGPAPRTARRRVDRRGRRSARATSSSPSRRPCSRPRRSRASAIVRSSS